jgi:hypothetical protein
MTRVPSLRPKIRQHRFCSRTLGDFWSGVAIVTPGMRAAACPALPDPAPRLRRRHVRGSGESARFPQCPAPQRRAAHALSPHPGRFPRARRVPGGAGKVAGSRLVPRSRAQPRGLPAAVHLCSTLSVNRTGVIHTLDGESKAITSF